MPPLDVSKIQPPRWMPRDDELGVSAGTRSLLVSNDRFAVALLDCIGYSNGFEFTVSIHFREQVSPQQLGYGMTPHPTHELSVRIEYPDGAEARSPRGFQDERGDYYRAIYEGRQPPEPVGPIVLPQRGGGGGTKYEYSFWCWPLPPDGPMTVAVEWQPAGIPPTTAEVDGSAIRRAGLASTKLWTA